MIGITERNEGRDTMELENSFNDLKNITTEFNGLNSMEIISHRAIENERPRRIQLINIQIDTSSI